MQQTLFGFRNCAAFNLDPHGDVHYYTSRKTRNKALAEFREYAISRGLAVSAAQSGIYAVKRVVRNADVEWRLVESAEANEAEATS